MRHDDDPRLTPRARLQCIPTEGYSRLMLRMLDGITVMLDFDYLKIGQTDFVGIDRAFEQQAAPLPSMVSAVPLEAEVLHESQR